MVETNYHMIMTLLLDKQLKSGREKVIMLESLPFTTNPLSPFSHTHSVGSFTNKTFGFSKG